MVSRTKRRKGIGYSYKTSPLYSRLLLDLLANTSNTRKSYHLRRVGEIGSPTGRLSRRSRQRMRSRSTTRGLHVHDTHR